MLGIFAKWPAPGQVKTRLAAVASDGWDARVATAFLADTLDRLAQIDARRLLAFAPTEEEVSFAELARGRYELIPQGPGDLGERLARFVAASLGEGAAAVVVVGTDSPTLPPAFVEQAFEELRHADIVLGPATDGGYYLVGCRRFHPSLFSAIDWSGTSVLRQTVERLTDPAWRLAVLPPWYDIDDFQDWQMLVGHLAALRRAGIDPGVPHTEALAREFPS
ncbi:MAG TPA: TIGR04282 family arsenosugar biosynthesis glycosyltransferase [Gemmataceae bacterium]|nr:TIGR04282 family arsenosugar biosynthesis glycosyltransferase [Gemmataceae bacterium]